MRRKQTHPGGNGKACYATAVLRVIRQIEVVASNLSAGTQQRQVAGLERTRIIDADGAAGDGVPASIDGPGVDLRGSDGRSMAGSSESATKSLGPAEVTTCYPQFAAFAAGHQVFGDPEAEVAGGPDQEDSRRHVVAAC